MCKSFKERDIKLIHVSTDVTLKRRFKYLLISGYYSFEVIKYYSIFISFLETIKYAQMRSIKMNIMKE